MFRFWLPVACYLVSMLSPLACCADSPSRGQPSVEIRVGIRNVWKVGYPTLHTITIQSDGVPMSGTIGLQTCDGDGVPVLYRDARWRFAVGDVGAVTIEAIAMHGRATRPIHVILFDDDGHVRLDRELSREERGTPLPATQPWVLGIGRDLNLDQAAMKSAKGALPDYSTVQVSQASELPTLWEAYTAVDLVILSSSSETLNRQLTDPQTEALRRWIAMGGRCAMTLGAHAESLLQHPNIAAIIPGTFRSTSKDCDPAIMESLVGGQGESGRTQRLGNLECALFDMEAATVDLTTLNGNRTRLPLIARWAHGTGKVHFLATELDSDVLANWPNRTALLRYFLKDQWEKGEGRSDKQVYQGYDDLSGQLNATLDFFPKLQLSNLAQLSVIAGLLSLILGPLDFFVVSRAWNRPRATWLTLVICSLGGCLVVAGLNRSWKPREPSINCLSLVDIDFKTHQLIGRGFAHCYGGSRGAFDISARHASLKPKGDSPADNLLPAEGAAIDLDWLGQPGRGLGGFDSMVATDREMPRYEIVKEDQRGTRMQGVGIPAAGTKSLSLRWSESLTISESTYALTTVLGSADLLEGSVSNPLDIDLYNGFLVYRGRAYAMPVRFRSGDRVAFSSATIPKDITRRLQRRQNVGGEEKGTPWDPADRNKWDRLCELLCFHRAAGADAYSSLYHRYLSTLDGSDLLRLDRAILFAEIPSETLQWSIRRNGSPVESVDGEHRTFLRLIIPVSQRAKNGSSGSNSSSIPSPSSK